MYQLDHIASAESSGMQVLTVPGDFDRPDFI